MNSLDSSIRILCTSGRDVWDRNTEESETMEFSLNVSPSGDNFF